MSNRLTTAQLRAQQAEYLIRTGAPYYGDEPGIFEIPVEERGDRDEFESTDAHTKGRVVFCGLCSDPEHPTESNHPGGLVQHIDNEIDRMIVESGSAPSYAESQNANAHTFESGAKRSELKPAYRLIPPEFLERLAKRFAIGEEKYGALNYMRGLSDDHFVEQIVDHLYAHLLDYLKDGNKKDDNLAAMGWGIAVLCVLEANAPSVVDQFQSEREQIFCGLRERKQPTKDFYVGTKPQSAS